MELLVQAELRTSSGADTTSAEERRRSDADRLAAVADGDAEALAEFYDDYIDRVYGMVLLMLGDASRAEEVAAEAFVAVWRSARDYDPGCSPVPVWVMTVAHRCAVDRVRGGEFDRDRDVPPSTWRAGEQCPEGVAHVDEGHEDAGASGSVQHPLTLLPDAQREPISLAYFGGLDYREVAERLTVEPATVVQRVREGLTRLNLALKGDGGSGPDRIAGVADGGD